VDGEVWEANKEFGRLFGAPAPKTGLSAPIFFAATPQKRISAAIPGAWASSNFPLQNCDQPGFPLQFLSPCGACGISASIALLPVFSTVPLYGLSPCGLQDEHAFACRIAASGAWAVLPYRHGASPAACLYGPFRKSRPAPEKQARLSILAKLLFGTEDSGLNAVCQENSRKIKKKKIFEFFC
jgi:hypothetical protein